MIATTLNRLCIAYRKAKVDLYYSSHASLRATADYEEDLEANLQALLDRINGEAEDWIVESDFLGSWTLAAKSVTWDARDEFRVNYGNGLIYSSPSEEWSHWEKRIAKSGEDKYLKAPKAEFRLMAKCSLDFHVLSTLWMLEVGEKLDKKLTDCAYGNRLRRTQDGQHINELSLGTFTPYLRPFREWRDRGIATMTTGLEANKKLVALTADVSSFYHELNPHFMLSETFLRKVCINRPNACLAPA